MASGHRVDLADGWTLWRWARLRGAGFPSRAIGCVAAPAAAEAAEALLAAEAAADGARAQVLRALREAQRASTGDAGTRLGRELKRVRSRRPAEAMTALAGDDRRALVEPLVTLEAAVAAAEAHFEHCCEDAARTVEAALRDVARAPRFREAVLWQNRHAVTTGLASFVRHTGDATARTRKQARMVASYLQRYCTKNDTIGFFGPNGWCRLDPANDASTQQPGPTLLAARSVYFEYWAIDALAQRLAADPELRPWLAPRRAPTLWLDGKVLHHPVDRTTELPLAFAELLRRCDGERTAAEIAEHAIADGRLDLDETDEVYELLEQLAARDFLTWTIELPAATAHPEHHLRALLERAGSAGTRGLAVLDELERGRAAVARAAGDPDALDRALGGLEETFERLTGVAATRAGGQTYAARTLVYEDCRRDTDVVLGRAVLRRLAPPLALVLQSARWYTFEIAGRYERAFRRIYNEERSATGTTAVDYLRFWQRARELFVGRAGGGIVDDVTHELQARWERILALGEHEESDDHVELTAGAIRAQVTAAFAAPHPGWPSARHHSPDVLISAPALADDPLLVLGEIHVGMNTAAVQVALEQHPDPASLIAAREADLPRPGIGTTWSRSKTRADFYSPSARDYELETGEARSARPRDHVLAVGALVIDERAGALIVRPRGDGPVFDLIAFVEQHLIAESFSRFEILAPRPHTPRVVVDGVVLARERWRFTTDQLAFTGEPTPSGRFLAIRRWARAHGMPRRVFVKLDTEVKPMFVDLDSPILVEIVIGDAARAREAVVTEMLPGLDECWLADADGDRYTSELRMVATDPEVWAPGGAP